MHQQFYFKGRHLICQECEKKVKENVKLIIIVPKFYDFITLFYFFNSGSWRTTEGWDDLSLIISVVCNHTNSHPPTHPATQDKYQRFILQQHFFLYIIKDKCQGIPNLFSENKFTSFKCSLSSINLNLALPELGTAQPQLVHTLVIVNPHPSKLGKLNTEGI